MYQLNSSPYQSINLVIGPNRLGESTIFCAISLIFPKFLDAGVAAQDFIQQGKESAEAEIELGCQTMGRGMNKNATTGYPRVSTLSETGSHLY